MASKKKHSILLPRRTGSELRYLRKRGSGKRKDEVQGELPANQKHQALVAGPLLTLRQNSEAVHGPGKLIGGNFYIQPADACSETSNRRKESSNFPANSCQCFCVTDAPEIHQSPGLVVVSEFLTAIQARDVGSSAVDRPASWQVGRN